MPVVGACGLTLWTNVGALHSSFAPTWCQMIEKQPITPKYKADFGWHSFRYVTNAFFGFRLYDMMISTRTFSYKSKTSSILINYGVVYEQTSFKARLT